MQKLVQKLVVLLLKIIYISKLENSNFVNSYPNGAGKKELLMQSISNLVSANYLMMFSYMKTGFVNISLTFLRASVDPEMMKIGLKMQCMKSPKAAIINALVPLSRLSDLNE